MSAPVTDHARSNAAIQSGTVSTDLPEAKSATRPSVVIPHRNDSGTDYISRRTTIDPKTQEVIFRIIDTRTQQIIRQVPDEDLLRSRAYSKAIEGGSSPFEAQVQADFEV